MKDIGAIWIDSVRVATLQPYHDSPCQRDRLSQAERDGDFALLADHRNGAQARPCLAKEPHIRVRRAFLSGVASGIAISGVLQIWLF
jgi:hypothetical protein